LSRGRTCATPVRGLPQRPRPGSGRPAGNLAVS